MIYCEKQLIEATKWNGLVLSKLFIETEIVSIKFIYSVSLK